MKADRKDLVRGSLGLLDFVIEGAMSLGRTDESSPTSVHGFHSAILEALLRPAIWNSLFGSPLLVIALVPRLGP